MIYFSSLGGICLWLFSSENLATNNPKDPNFIWIHVPWSIPREELEVTRAWHLPNDPACIDRFNQTLRKYFVDHFFFRFHRFSFSKLHPLDSSRENSSTFSMAHPYQEMAHEAQSCVFLGGPEGNR